MRTYSLLSVLLFFLCQVSFAQNDTTITTVLSKEETKQLLSKLNLDTVQVLRDYSEKACKCIDSITVSGKADKEIANDIATCIDKQALLYQSVIETNRAIKEGNLNIEINANKESRQYKEYYFRLEEWLSDSCASLKNAMTNNNKEGKYSMSKNEKAWNSIIKVLTS
jgi:dTDP-glucose pyrophosphorylase